METQEENVRPILTTEELFWSQDRDLQTGTLTINNGYTYTYDKGILQGLATSPNGDKIHFVDGILLSSTEFPAIEYANGDKMYYLDDILVRVIKSDGTILTSNQIP